MKRLLIAAGIIATLALLILVGMLLYKHYITDQIMDRDGMINPNCIINSDTAPIAEPTEEEVTQ